MSVTAKIVDFNPASYRARISSIRDIETQANPGRAHSCERQIRVPARHTGVKIQESLLKYLKRAGNRFVWLRGSPGTGKTAISMSVASTLKEQGMLAASFFWDKNQTGTGLDSIKLFPSTLACQLASFNEDFKLSFVRRRLRQRDLVSIQGLPLDKQINTLIIEPMRDLEDIWPLGKDRVVIVLDGLDECGDQQRLGSLMELVLAFQELPPIFSVLVSCRPEPKVISAWDEARAQGHAILCEDLDKVVVREAFHTVRCMVEEGLQHLFDKYLWKPDKWELGAFARACWGLPVMASIRVRDVVLQTRRGRTLQSVFRELLNLTNAPANLNWEYLRILRQAYMLDSSDIHPDVAKKYRSVVGAIVAARMTMNVSFMSQLFKIGEDEIRATLEPISSIVNLPSENTEEVTLYHATAQEFITGEPIGDEKDKVFFIDDVKGYFLGLPLLRLFKNYCDQDAFGIPTNPPLGDERIWKEFMAKKEEYWWRFSYVIKHLFKHLDPSRLFSQESNELQNEFNSFITQKYILTFMHLQDVEDPIIFPDELHQFNNHNSIQLLRDLHLVASTAAYKPWELYRSKLPFAPPSSSVYKQYGHLCDVRIFSAFGEFSGGTIPLSKDLLSAREVMQAKLSTLPDAVYEGRRVTNYEAEFREPDVRNGIVTCAALSLNGRYIALGFGSGIIEVADIDHQCTICRLQHDPANFPAWIEFVHGSHRVATEDNNGNVMILGDGMIPVNLDTLPTGPYPAGTTASGNGLFVVRVPRNLDDPWCDNMMLISVSEVPSIQPLASPPFSPSSQFHNTKLVIPHRRTLGFSPGARYVGAFDGTQAVTWSTKSCQCIVGYRVTNFDYWIINPNVPPTRSYLIPDPMFTRATIPSVEGDMADEGLDSVDEFWIKCPFYDISPLTGSSSRSIYSSAVGRTPLIQFSSVWFDGRAELELPSDFYPDNPSWYGDRMLRDYEGIYCPQSSRDGTRFLLQGRKRAPIVVDISQIV
ncbi:uncharacterized protein EI90DRAFT_3017645 [Cantharellus anzutake]|uniref:uncharacterized protein n=1 Tax=Cantharellus anzutake TaxID=1750568 RepID=UPI001906FDD7|nr:uncharacterized protein EI90DRAFT_3017645 [Cantharellus anzutake]KAF8328606.1 hypothetical protein EI90DRAFT_3017645 [Cantharellus anzutake]